MQQMELFTDFTSPASASSPTATVTQTWPLPLRRRSESVPAPHHTGPISHATGGPLNAEESARVVRGRSIRIAGWWWPDSSSPVQTAYAICKACFDQEPKMPDEPARFGLGYCRPIWSQEYRGDLSCAFCLQRIRP
jgi:hypothetical protein